jgi:hypothetical protein
MAKLFEEGLVRYLKATDFILHSEYLTNTRYVKALGEHGKLYVRSLDGHLREVSYEQIPINPFEQSAVVILHGVDTQEKLDFLLKALG